jgi:AAA domain-containing protein
MSTSENSFSMSGKSLPPAGAASPASQADAELHEALRRGEYCLVLTPSEMGKLARVRAAARLREEGVTIVVLALTAVEEHGTAEPWYHALLERMGQQLGLEEELEQYWREHDRLSALQRWMAALREVALARVVESHELRVESSDGSDSQLSTLNSQLAGRLVIFVDEVEAARALPFSIDEFFAAIRECYNRRTQDPMFDRLTFCLLGTVRLSDLIRDSRTTAFNIGRRIDLSDADNPDPGPGDPGPRHKNRMPALLKRALDWIGGEPYVCCRTTSGVGEIQKLTPARPTSCTGFSGLKPQSIS